MNESENASNAASYNNTPNVSAPATPNPTLNAANQSDSSQSATGPLNNSGIPNTNNSNSQNSNSASQPASSPAVSGMKQFY